MIFVVVRTHDIIFGENNSAYLKMGFGYIHNFYFIFQNRNVTFTRWCRTQVQLLVRKLMTIATYIDAILSNKYFYTSNAKDVDFFKPLFKTRINSI